MQPNVRLVPRYAARRGGALVIFPAGADFFTTFFAGFLAAAFFAAGFLAVAFLAVAFFAAGFLAAAFFVAFAMMELPVGPATGPTGRMQRIGARLIVRRLRPRRAIFPAVPAFRHCPPGQPTQSAGLNQTCHIARAAGAPIPSKPAQSVNPRPRTTR